MEPRDRDHPRGGAAAIKRLALYARVSTDEQAEKYGLAGQVHELRKHAAATGGTVVGEFVDDGYSGATLDRPQLEALRALVRTRAVDVVLIHAPDRLSRDLAHQLLLLKEIEKVARVEFLHGAAGDTVHGRLLRNVQGVIAEYEREIIRDRTMRGRREKARRGLWVGSRRPYGYVFNPAAPGTLCVHEEEAATVRMIFRWLVEDRRSVRGIVAELRALGVKPQRGRAWGNSSVRRILTEERYIGRAYFNRRHVVDHERSGKRTAVELRPRDEWIPVAIPALVDEALFARAEAQLMRNRAVLVGRPSTRFYLLSGLLRCGRCGRRFGGQPERDRIVYRCAGRDRLTADVPCRRRVDGALLEQLVWDTVADVLRRPEVVLRRLRAYQATLGAREVEVRSEAEVVRRELSAIEVQQMRLLDLYQDGFAVDDLRRRLAELSARREHLRARLTAIEAATAHADAATADEAAVLRACATFQRGLDRLTPTQRREVLQALLDTCVVDEGRVELRGWLPAGELSATPSSSVRPAPARRCSHGDCPASCRRSRPRKPSKCPRSGARPDCSEPTPGWCAPGRSARRITRSRSQA
jgi:site-specific DNA recombinase